MSDNVKISPYKLLNNWLFDGNRDSEIPKEVLEAHNISNLILLYHFQVSRYIIFINKMFNNYGLFAMKKEDVLKFLKTCVSKTNYRPPFILSEKDAKVKISKILSRKYPYLKRGDISILIDYIDSSDDKNSIYEMLGLYKPKKKKTTKKQLKELQKENISLGKF